MVQIKSVVFMGSNTFSGRFVVPRIITVSGSSHDSDKNDETDAHADANHGGCCDMCVSGEFSGLKCA